MQINRHSKINLSQDYPCPCRRRGRLIPIVLTEAFGCDRCQQIFVVHESGETIEQLSSTYAQKRVWRWTGHQWSLAQATLGQEFLPLALMVLLGLVIVLLIATLNAEVGLRVGVVTVLLATLAFVLWFAYRR
ncbi:MAG: hypothetical protein ACFB4J_06075 [Elainellaceae cyanobacterium]